MAKPGELAELIARLFKLEEATVRQQARELRDHGLMSKEKGGRGAGSMTALDAAHLLVAAAATTSVKKSAAVVHDYRSCVVRESGRENKRRWNPDFLPDDSIATLSELHSIVDFLEAVIYSFAFGYLSGRRSDFQKSFIAGKTMLSVGLSAPHIRAHAGFLRASKTETVRGMPKTEASDSLQYGQDPETEIDYHINFSFGHETIISIADLLADRLRSH